METAIATQQRSRWGAILACALGGAALGLRWLPGRPDDGGILSLGISLAALAIALGSALGAARRVGRDAGRRAPVDVRTRRRPTV